MENDHYERLKNKFMGCGTSAQVSIGTINKTPYVITLLGLPGVGKTSLLEWLIGDFVCFIF